MGNHVIHTAENRNWAATLLYALHLPQLFDLPGQTYQLMSLIETRSRQLARRKLDIRQIHPNSTE